MTTNLIQSIVLLMLAVSFAKAMWDISKLEDRITGIEEKRSRLYRQLADPAVIEADMEKSARAREMYDANRRYLPREGAGPPAKVHRARVRKIGDSLVNWRIKPPKK